MLKNIIVLFGVVTLMACGGSSTPADDTVADTTAPTVSTVKDTNDATVETTATTGVNPTSFDITFSEAMDDTSVTTEGNITLVCSDVAAVITVAAHESTANTYTATVTNPELNGYQECVLTIGTNVTDAAINAIAEAAYTFNTACSTDDSFVVDTLGFTDASDAHMVKVELRYRQIAARHLPSKQLARTSCLRLRQILHLAIFTACLKNLMRDRLRQHWNSLACPRE